MLNKFAFLVHPRNTVRADMGMFFGAPFGLVPEIAWRTIFARLPVPPLLTGRMSYVNAPSEPAGFLITVPLTPTQLLTLPPKQVQAKVSAAVDKARDLGASVVGLGALTATASVGGKSLAKRNDIGVTNGNAFTAAMTLAGIERLMPRLGPDPLIAIVGATGSVGSCLSRLFARKHSGRLLLVARNKGRLDALAAELRAGGLEATSSNDMSDIRQADLVVLLTSAADCILRGEHLKHGAVVLDDTVPRNTDKRLLTERPDLLVIDGGVVEVPGAILEDCGIGLAPRLAYACLAETMLLALGGHKGHFSIGTPSVEQAEHIVSLAAQHRDVGFTLAPFRSFGRLLSEPSASLPSISAKETATWAAS